MQKNYFDFKGQVALVTGCSTGLGVQMAKALASQGCNIVGVARREDLLKKVCEEIKKEYKVETLAIKCDLSDSKMIKEMVQKAYNHFKRIDILINNAGIGSPSPAEKLTDEQFDNEIKIDLTGVFKCARECANIAMIPAKYGRIINISSMFGLVGNRATPTCAYHAAKGGVCNLTRALAAEWAKYNITVNCICLGFFWTPLTKDIFETESFKKYAKQTIPVERYGKEGELDTTALFLASKFSSYVTGTNIPVDGGYTCV